MDWLEIIYLPGGELLPGNIDPPGDGGVSREPPVGFPCLCWFPPLSDRATVNKQGLTGASNICLLIVLHFLWRACSADFNSKPEHYQHILLTLPWAYLDHPAVSSSRCLHRLKCLSQTLEKPAIFFVVILCDISALSTTQSVHPSITGRCKGMGNHVQPSLLCKAKINKLAGRGTGSVASRTILQ